MLFYRCLKCRMLIWTEQYQSVRYLRYGWNGGQLQLLRRWLIGRVRRISRLWSGSNLKNHTLLLCRIDRGRRYYDDLRPFAEHHRTILIQKNQGLNASDYTQDNGQANHPVGLLLLACGVTLLIAIVLGMYAADWSNSVISDLLICVAGALALDALISWALGHFPWDWL